MRKITPDEYRKQMHQLSEERKAQLKIVDEAFAKYRAAIAVMRILEDKQNQLSRDYRASLTEALKSNRYCQTEVDQ